MHTGGLGVLTADAEAPVVAEPAVGADLLQALEVIAELGVDAVGEDLAVLAVDDIALPVEEPGGDLVCIFLMSAISDLRFCIRCCVDGRARFLH